jgi:hypothetical protein
MSSATLSNKTRMQSTVVTQITVENRRQHEGFVEQLIDPLLVGLNSHNTILRKRSGSLGNKSLSYFSHARRQGDNKPSESNRMLCKTFLMITGLKTLSWTISVNQLAIMNGTDANLKLSTGPCNTDGCLVPHDLSCNHRHSLALRRIHFSWHDAASWFIFWEADLSKATTRTRAKEPNVVGNLHERAGKDIQGSVGLNKGIMGSQSFKLSKKP